MRTLLTSYPFIIFLAALVALLYPSCEPADPVIEKLPATATILLDFSDPNTHAGNTGGYRYLYEGESYSATYNAWASWSCEAGPEFFAAWNDTSLTVWLAHCPATLHLESITAQTGDGAPLPIESWTPVTGAHEPTYQLTLHPVNYLDIENGVTTINLQSGVADIDRQLFNLYQKQYDNHDITPEEYLLKRKAFLLQELRNQDQITRIEALQFEIEDLAGCLTFPLQNKQPSPLSETFESTRK